jgi:DNA-directed RNA polymerase specialized sigma24 family protein
VTTEPDSQQFEEFAAEAAPRLQRALVAAYGSERGHEATAEALGYAWEHWNRIAGMANPVGYLYRVGQSRTRPRKQSRGLPAWEPRDATSDGPRVEPALRRVLASLTEHQRVAVVLVHGFGWTLREVAEVMELSTSTIQSHVERALEKLRTGLEVRDDV